MCDNCGACKNREKPGECRTHNLLETAMHQETGAISDIMSNTAPEQAGTGTSPDPRAPA